MRVLSDLGLDYGMLVLKAWLNRPFFGYGGGGSHVGINEEVAKGAVSKHLFIAEPEKSGGNLHNDYINTLVDKGIIGLALRLSFLMFIFFVFFRLRQQHNQLAFMGMVFILAHMIFSLTESPFIRDNHTAIFYLTLAVLWALKSDKNQQT